MISLALRTARRPEDEGDQFARQELYLADLQKWPLEIAVKALELASEQSPFFPTWHDLLQLLNRLTADAHCAARFDNLLPAPQDEQSILERLASALDRGLRPFTMDEREHFKRWHHWASQLDGELAEWVTRILSERME